MKAIFEAGLKVPDAICVVGAGNVHYSDVLRVPLTTVDQGTAQIGTRAAELVMERIAAKRTLRSRRVLIPPKLLIRESSQREAEHPVVSLPGARFRDAALEEKET